MFAKKDGTETQSALPLSETLSGMSWLNFLSVKKGVSFLRVS